MNIAANIFGLFAMVSLFLIYRQKTRKKFLLCKLSADIFWVFHYFFLGAFGGIVPNFVGIFREIIFLNKKENAKSNLLPLIFIAANLALGIKSFDHIYNILPILASVSVTTSMWLDDPHSAKKLTLPASVLFLVYDIFVLSYIGIINETLSIVSAIIYFTNSRKSKKETLQ